MFSRTGSTAATTVSNRKLGDKVDVPEDRKFIGFDAYKKAMDCLKPGDVAIFATPPAFRWVHFTYAIAKGLNVFMEKPLTADGPTTRRMLKLAEEATAKNLKVGVGLMSRHSRALQELHKRIQDGEIGDIILMRGYRMHGPVGSAFSDQMAWQPERTALADPALPQLPLGQRRLLQRLLHPHHRPPLLDEERLAGQGPGRRRTPSEGKRRGAALRRSELRCLFGRVHLRRRRASMLFDGRCINGCNDLYSSYAHGTKGIAVVSRHGDCGLPSSTYKGQNPDRASTIWKSKIEKDQQDPYTNEWNDLIDAIRNDKPYNEAKRGVEASLVTSMGRMAAHTGQMIEYRRHPQWQTRVRSGCGQARHERTRALDRRLRRSLSHPHARRQTRAGVLRDRSNLNSKRRRF